MPRNKAKSEWYNTVIIHPFEHYRYVIFINYAVQKLSNLPSHFCARSFERHLWGIRVTSDSSRTPWELSQLPTGRPGLRSRIFVKYFLRWSGLFITKNKGQSRKVNHKRSAIQAVWKSPYNCLYWYSFCPPIDTTNSG